MIVDEPRRPQRSRSPQGPAASPELEASDENDRRVTIVVHEPGRPELPWLRFLLGDLAGDVVEDTGGAVAPPYSVIVTTQPSKLGTPALAKIRRTGTVGLFHVGDNRYKARMDTYEDFGFVWRSYLHSALLGAGVRQLPLGPAERDVVSVEALPEAARPPARRRHTWIYAGTMQGTAPSMLEAMLRIEGGEVVPVAGAAPDSDSASVDRTTPRDGGDASETAETELLADTIFAPCPMEGTHIESSRIYDALELGAIPIVERRRRLDYLGTLLGDHPLPTVENWGQAPGMIRPLLNDPRALAERQRQVITWWAATKEAFAGAAQGDVRACFAGEQVRVADVPLDRPPPRWRGRVESLRHRSPVRQRRQNH